MMKLFKQTFGTREINAIRRELIMPRWNMIQPELMLELRNDVGPLTPKLAQVKHILEWVRIKVFTGSGWCGVGRHPHERACLANVFVATAVLGLASGNARLKDEFGCNNLQVKRSAKVMGSTKCSAIARHDHCIGRSNGLRPGMQVCCGLL